jgi:hypothetical protein
MLWLSTDHLTSSGRRVRPARACTGSRHRQRRRLPTRTLVTIDVRTGSPTFGQVIDVDSVGDQHEAHHGGFTDDRRQFWVAGLGTSKIFIFDVASDPANPRLIKTTRTLSRRAAG